ncbi:MAG: hypothetical protein ACO1TE_05570 [Prosthecobacter sp.]
MSIDLTSHPTPHERRRALFFWLGVGVLPVFWSWFTLSQRRFSTWQRRLAFGWMGGYVLLLACCAQEWFVSRGELLAADPHGVPAAFGLWMFLGVACWLIKLTGVPMMMLLFAYGPHLGHVFGPQAGGPFLLMAICLQLARRGLSRWENAPRKH